TGMAKCYRQLGILSSKTGKSSKAIEYFKTSLAMFEELKDERLLAETMINYASHYYFISDFPKALDIYNKSITLCEKTNNKPCLARTCYYIPLIYYTAGVARKTLKIVGRGLGLGG